MQDQMELHAIVYGYVQGVGFRATTQYMANRFGLVGTVRNVPDGTVEIYAQGSKGELENFIRELQSKNSGYVDNISTQYAEPKHNFQGFQIVH